jgi:D-amino-acid dehydrogenase
MADGLRVGVIGGGVVGLCVAYALTGDGHEVTVLDAAQLGAGTSLGNTGWVTPSFSYPLAAPGVVREGLRAAFDRNGALVMRPGLDPAFLAWLWRFRQRATLERMREGTRVLIELNRHTLELFDEYAAAGVAFEMHASGLVVVAKAPEKLNTYRESFAEMRRLGHDAGLVELDLDELIEAEPALDRATVRAGMRATVDRFVRPESLSAGLAVWLRAHGADLREGWPVASLARDGAGWRVAGAAGADRFDRVVVATGLGSVALMRTLGVKLAMVGAKGYSITSRGSGTAPRTALYLAEPRLGISGYDGAVRIAGVFELPGRDTNVDARRIERFTRTACSYLADWQPTDDVSSWAGLRPATPDGLPILGPADGLPGLYLATGHGMLGITLGPATGARIAGLVRAER